MDYVELCNVGTTDALDLDGIRFTSGIDYSVPSGTTLSPGEHLLIVNAESANNYEAFRNHYGLSQAVRILGPYVGSLSNGGEKLSLKSAAAGDFIATFEYSDGRGWPLQADGAGHSLVPLVMDGQAEGALDYGGNWRASTFMKGSPGMADPEPPATVMLNEFQAHTDTGFDPPLDSNDRIELYHTGPGSVSLADWYLSDNDDDLRKWAIPATNVIGPGEWLAFEELTDFHTGGTNGFGLDKAGERLFLSYLPGTAEDRVVDAVRFKGQENGVTLGRYPDGDTYWRVMLPTLGTTNALPVRDVVLAELMVHPPATATVTEFSEGT